MARVKFDDFTSTGDNSSTDKDEEIEALANQLKQLDFQEEALNKRRVEELTRMVAAQKKNQLKS